MRGFINPKNIFKITPKVLSIPPKKLILIFKKNQNQRFLSKLRIKQQEV
jgi:hypothetical protein